MPSSRRAVEKAEVVAECRWKTGFQPLSGAQHFELNASDVAWSARSRITAVAASPEGRNGCAVTAKLQVAIEPNSRVATSQARRAWPNSWRWPTPLDAEGGRRTAHTSCRSRSPGYPALPGLQSPRPGRRAAGWSRQRSRRRYRSAAAGALQGFLRPQPMAICAEAPTIVVAALGQAWSHALRIEDAALRPSQSGS